MGIPKFFRWISERYPLVNQMLSDSDPPEFDNLYLDMNGIIHHCSHPFEDSTKNVLTEKEMFISVVHYVDRLLHIVKPRKLLYLAIDGVAPRAKMNQQRQRRFRSARDSADAIADLLAKGLPLPKDKPFDSNCITPGTEFMATLSAHLHFFIRKKISEDSRWKKIKVIFSGHDVPGEGEHKIMEYIRHNKAQPSWDPNQTHCLYGLDADLIMLALASHEPHFALLREDVLTKQKKGNKSKITGETSQSELEFHLFHISMVREYLDLEYSKLALDFPYSVDRVIDDFILMCFFVGNDFLPHMAHLDIAEGGLNTMLTLYKTVLPTLGGFLVDNAEINWERVEKFLVKLGQIERKLLEGVPLGDFFDEKPNNDIENEKEFNGDEREEQTSTSTPIPVPGSPTSTPSSDAKPASPPPIREHELERMILESNEEDEGSDDFEWKDTYYKEKLHVPCAEARDGAHAEFHHKLRHAYKEGITWVMKYYFLGCPSWSWFYPYYYAPLASDLVNLSKYEVKFDMGTPFTPFQQLLGVLPAVSGHFLPEPYRALMTLPTSPIIDFYPTEFQIDMTGKKNAWEGIVLLPFIDQDRLTAACSSINEDTLSIAEKERNRLGHAHELVYDTKSHGKWTSPAPYLTDIMECHIASTVHHLPPLSPDARPFYLLPGTNTGKHAPSGFPTLQTREFSVVYMHSKINIFGFPSKHENVILKLPEPDLHTAEEVAAQLVGTKCYVNWPYLVEAVVVGASDAQCKFYSPQHVYNPNSNSPIPSHHSITSASGNGTHVSSPSNGAQQPQRTGANDKSALPHPSPTPTGESTSHSDTSSNTDANDTTKPNSEAGVADTSAATSDSNNSNGNANTDAKSPVNPEGVKPPQSPNGTARNGPATELVKKITTAEAAGYFKKDTEWYQSKLLIKKGIESGPIQVMLHVRLLDGMETDADGGRAKKFSKEETQWPYQLSRPLSCLQDDTRYVEIASRSLESRFPPSVPILYMGQQYTGALGNVDQISGNAITISVSGNQTEPRFGAKIAQQTAEVYYPLYQVARKLSVSTKNLSKVTGSVYFEPGRFNLGLNIKFSGKNLQVPGYTRKIGEGSWEFSERAIQLIEQYKAKFPRVFELLDLGEDPYNVSDLLPSTNSPANKRPPVKSPTAPRASATNTESTSTSDAAPPSAESQQPTSSTNGTEDKEKEKPVVSDSEKSAPGEDKPEEPTAHQIAKEIQAWLKTLPTDSIPKVPCGSDSMTKDGIKQVETFVAQLNAQSRKKTLRNVSPADIVGPRDDGLSFNANFLLGDRVVYALDHTPVPFGLRGTVVASKGNTLDVLFDSDFIGGTTLDGACSEFRGKNVPVNSVYNITRYNGKPHSPSPSPSHSPANSPGGRTAWGPQNRLNSNSPHQSPPYLPHQSQTLPHQQPYFRQQPSYSPQQRQGFAQQHHSPQQHPPQPLAPPASILQPPGPHPPSIPQALPVAHQASTPQRLPAKNNKPQKEYKPKSPTTSQQSSPTPQSHQAEQQLPQPPQPPPGTDDLTRLYQQLQLSGQPPQHQQAQIQSQAQTHQQPHKQKQYQQKQPQQPQPQLQQPQLQPPQQPQLQLQHQPQQQQQPQQQSSLQSRQQRSMQRQQQRQQKQQLSQNQPQSQPQNQPQQVNQPQFNQQQQVSQPHVQRQQQFQQQHQFHQQQQFQQYQPVQVQSHYEPQPQRPFTDPKDALTWQQQLLQPPSRNTRSNPRGTTRNPRSQAVPPPFAPPMRPLDTHAPAQNVNVVPATAGYSSGGDGTALNPIYPAHSVHPAHPVHSHPVHPVPPVHAPVPNYNNVHAHPPHQAPAPFSAPQQAFYNPHVPSHSAPVTHPTSVPAPIHNAPVSAHHPQAPAVAPVPSSSTAVHSAHVPSPSPNPTLQQPAPKPAPVAPFPPRHAVPHQHQAQPQPPQPQSGESLNWQQQLLMSGKHKTRGGGQVGIKFEGYE